MKGTKKRFGLLTAIVLIVLSVFAGCEQEAVVEAENEVTEPIQVISEMEGGPENGMDGMGPQPALDENGVEIGRAEDVYTFDNAPVEIIREGVNSFELPSGETHWYEVIYLPEGGINWVQAKNLAEQAGGYLVSFHSDEENEYVFSLIDDEKYWFTWEENNVCNGPFIGAFQPIGAAEPDGGWQWISGEEWTYTNWAVDGMEGDDDPRPNDQPNDATGNQCVGAFGEITVRVATWGDFPLKMSSFEDDNEAKAFGFVIEYDEEPA